MISRHLIEELAQARRIGTLALLDTCRDGNDLQAGLTLSSSVFRTVRVDFSQSYDLQGPGKRCANMVQLSCSLGPQAGLDRVRIMTPYLDAPKQLVVLLLQAAPHVGQLVKIFLQQAHLKARRRLDSAQQEIQRKTSARLP